MTTTPERKIEQLEKEMAELKKSVQPATASDNFPADKRELLDLIFDGSKNAVKTMEKIFKQHEDIETAVLSPDSWVGAEILLQTRRLIDIRHDIHNLTSSINLLSRNISKLLNSK